MCGDCGEKRPNFSHTCLRLEAWEYYDPKAAYNQTFVNLFVPSVSYNLGHVDMSTPTNKRQKGADGNAVGGAYGNRNMGAPPRSHPSNGNRLVYFSLFEQTGTSISYLIPGKRVWGDDQVIRRAGCREAQEFTSQSRNRNRHRDRRRLPILGNSNTSHYHHNNCQNASYPRNQI